MSQFVIHAPHASITIPPELRDQFIPSPHALAAEAPLSVDLLIDELARAAWRAATIVGAEVSRLVVVVERCANDGLEPMAAVGRGMIHVPAAAGPCVGTFASVSVLP